MGRGSVRRMIFERVVVIINHVMSGGNENKLVIIKTLK